MVVIYTTKENKSPW